MTEIQFEAYRRLLAGVPEVEIARAVACHLRSNTFMPRPAEILKLAGRDPDSMARKAFAGVIAWLEEWGVEGRKDSPYPTFEEVGNAVRIVRAEYRRGPALPAASRSAVAEMGAGDFRRGARRLLDAEPDKLPFLQREFAEAWKRYDVAGGGAA